MVILDKKLDQCPVDPARALLRSDIKNLPMRICHAYLSAN